MAGVAVATFDAAVISDDLIHLAPLTPGSSCWPR